MLVYLVVPSCGYVVQYEFEVLTPAFSLCFVGDFYLLPILFVVPHFEWSPTLLAPILSKILFCLSLSKLIIRLLHPSTISHVPCCIYAVISLLSVGYRVLVLSRGNTIDSSS